MQKWCRACGHGVMEIALGQVGGEDAQRPVRPMDWDQSLVELTTVITSRIPPRVEEQWGRARHRANCGLLPALRHAWVSVDSTLFMWDYCSQGSAVLTEFQADSVIISVAVCPARAGVFNVPSIQFLLVLATRLTVSLIAVVPEHVEGGPPSLATHGQAASHADGQPRNKIQLMPLGGYSVSVDGALFHCIRHNHDGNIFLLCGAPQVYEVAYSRTSGLFHPKCRLIRHSLGWWPWARDFVSISPHMSGRVRLLECAPHGYLVTVDDANTLRLLRLQDADGPSDHSSSSLEELSSLTVSEMSARLFALTKMRLSSLVIVHVFPCLGLDDHLHLHAVTAAGERLHFVCSASSPTGPSSVGPAVQAARVTNKANQRFHGFWLQQVLPGNHNSGSAVSNSWSGANSLSSAGLDKPRTACIEEDQDPCLYSSGVWVASLRKAGVAATDVGVTARIDGATCGAGTSGFLELCSVLKFDGQALDIAEEHDLSNRFFREAPLDGNFGAFCGRRSFAILFPDGVKLLSLSYRAQTASRSPTSAQECCAHLMQLCLPPSSASVATWTWSLDDAHIPSFEEQQQHMALAHTVPPMHLGRWFGGLLRFLAIVLRPVWSSPLIVPMATTPILHFYKRRRVTGSCLALNEGLVHHVLDQLRPALQFATRGCAAQSSQTPHVNARAASRSRYFARKLVNNGEIQVQAQQLLSEVLDISKNVQEILGFLSVVHRHKRVQALMQNPALSDELLGVLCERPIGTLSATAHSLEPVVHLCSILHAECSHIYPGGHPGSQTISQDLREMCPAIFEQVIVRHRARPPGEEESKSVRGDSSQTPRPSEPVPVPEPSPATAVSTGGKDVRHPAAAGPSGTDILRQFARFLPSEPVQDHWAALARILPAVAGEDLPAAVQLCAEELQRLPQGEAASPGRAESLLIGLLQEVIERPASEIRHVLEILFNDTRSLQFAHSHEGVSAGLPFVHTTVLSQLLTGAEACGKQGQPAAAATAEQHIVSAQAGACRRALEVLLTPPFVVDIKAFLQHRCASSRTAGECLCKFYSENQQFDQACGMWMTLAERPDQLHNLQKRIHDLHRAMELAESSREPWAQEAVQHLTLRLRVAEHVQVPLQQELGHMAQDAKLSAKWRQAAKHRQQELSVLHGLPELCQTAEEFGLFHITLVIADFADPAFPCDQWSMFWVNVFCPPATCPYWMANTGDTAGSPPVAVQSGNPSTLFPLLMVRQLKAFYCLGSVGPPQLLSDMAVGTHPELAVCLELRVTALFEELRHLTKVPGPCWDVRFIATILEYCNCVWFHAVDPHETSAQDRVASSPRAWAALRVLSMKPFSFSLADTVHLYAQMLTHVPTWVKELQERLPEGVRWPALGDDDLQVHLSEVLLALLSRLVSEMQLVAATDAPTVRSLRGAWKDTGEGLLADLGLRLNGLQVHHPAARRLLPETFRLEAAGRHACSQMQAPATQAFKAILQPEAAPAFDLAAGGMGVETQ